MPSSLPKAVHFQYRNIESGARRLVYDAPSVHCT